MADDILKAQNLADTMNTAAAEALPVARAIDDKTVINATNTLRKYQEAKQYLTDRLIGNENWWRIRHWRNLNQYGETADERLYLDDKR